jgi:hypothetical protein
MLRVYHYRKVGGVKRDGCDNRATIRRSGGHLGQTVVHLCGECRRVEHQKSLQNFYDWLEILGLFLLWLTAKLGTKLLIAHYCGG